MGFKANNHLAPVVVITGASSMDVTNEDDMFRTADEVEEKLGPIDIWVNNAWLLLGSLTKKP